MTPVAGLLVVVLIIGLVFGAGTASLIQSPGKDKTVTEIQTVAASTISTIATSFSVSVVTFTQQAATLFQTSTVTAISTQPPSTVTNTQTQTSTLTTTSTKTETQTTIIIYSQTATISQTTTNGQIVAVANLAPNSGTVYPNMNQTVYVTISNGVGQILNMTFSPFVQTSSQADAMKFYPSTFFKIVPTGTTTFTFSVIVKSYSSQAPSADYKVQIPITYVLNGNPGSIATALDVTILNPMTVSSWALSGQIGGSCTFKPNPNSIGDYNCTITGSPNQSGAITWQGANQGQQQSCLTWITISTVVQVFANSISGNTPCTSNGQNGIVINPGPWTISFTLGIPSSASNQSNNVEFVWG